VIDGKHWTALFSHTGSEIVKLSSRLKRPPDVIITNKTPTAGDINKDLTEVVYTPNKPSIADYRNLFQSDTLVTLHGWMRIIPPEICEEYEIYNLHPGLITKYPELKGADPQKRAAEADPEYSHIGCVVHRVTPGVDEGPVLGEASVYNVYSGEKQISCRLHEMATELWLDVFKQK
jgi:methionyl-tRNA formyltransferase